tara:strand:+ start:2602 stop:3384 length:783 start_codon:yes stop_codon:yes gene_type:complete
MASELNVGKVVASTSADDAKLTLSTYSALANYSLIQFNKSDTDTVNAAGVTDSADVLGRIIFAGYGSSAAPGNPSVGADIKVTQTAGAGANHVPSKMVFSTSDSDSTDVRLTIDSAGAVTMPSTPAFSAMPSTNQNNLAADTYTDIVLATEIFDQGANFASNTFTAPVAGRYQFSALIAMNYIDSAANFYQIRIVTSNRTYSYTFDPDFGQDAIYWEGGPSILADMDASDTAKVEFYQSGGTAQTDIVATRTVFTGFLAC